MTVPCNSGFSEAAKFLAGEAADAFHYVAIGTGTGQTADKSTLVAETVVAGLTRADAVALTKTVTTDVANDTHQSVHKFTAGAPAHIKEAGSFNNAVKDAGDMLMVGDLAPSADMILADTLTITLETQVKAA